MTSVMDMQLIFEWSIIMPILPSLQGHTCSDGAEARQVMNCCVCLLPMKVKQVSMDSAWSYWRHEILKSVHRLRRPFFGWGIFILKTMMFDDETTVLNQRKHLKMVIRSVPDSVRQILGKTK
jgi:hypothetical protein